MGEAITSGQQSQTSAMGNDLTALSKAFYSDLQKLIPALLTQRYVAPKSLSPLPTPFAGCSAAALSQELSKGIGNVAATQQVFNNVISQYNNATVSKQVAIQNLATMPPKSLTADAILPPALMASAAYPSANDAARYVTVLTNPLPPVQLNSDQKKSSAGVEWQAQVNAQQNRQTLAQAALNWLAGGTQPTMDAGMYQDLWKTSQMPGPMPGVAASAPGMSGPAVSRNAAMDIVSRSFYANPNFQKGLTTASKYQIEAQATILLGVSNANEEQSVHAMEYWTTLLASRYAAHLSGSAALQKISDQSAYARSQSIAP